MSRLWSGLLLLCLAAATALAQGGNLPMRTDPRPAELLGTPIRGANLISYKLCPGYGAEGHDLLCWTTTAESGGHFCALDLTTDQLDIKPLNHLEAYPITPASDGAAYVGVTTGEIMRYRAAGSVWERLARPWDNTSSSIHHVRVLGEGRDGWLYAGSCYGERARVNKATGEVQLLPPLAEPGNWYVSSVAPLPDGRIAFGLGHVARLVIYDPVAGKDVGQWAPASWQSDGFVLNLAAGKSVLYAFHFPSGRRGAFDMATGEFLGEAPWPPMQLDPKWSRWWHSSGYGSGQDAYVVPGGNTLVACDGQRVFLWDAAAQEARDMPLSQWVAPPRLAGEMRWAVTTDLKVLEYDPQRLRPVRERAYAQPEVKRGLFGMGLGPDGNVYGGAFQSTHLFRCEAKTGKVTDLGDHNPGWSGETYSFCQRGKELVCASYINGAIVLYDPAQPWECDSVRQVNPRFVGCLGQLTYRPVSCASDARGRVWGVGPAGWGSTGGGVSFLDPETGAHGTTQLGEAPFYVAEWPPGVMLVAGSVLRWWDAETNRELARAAWPHAGAADAVVLERDGRRQLAIADSTGLHLADLPAAGQLTVTRTYPLPLNCARLLAEGGALLVGGDQGIAELDLATGQWTRLGTHGLGLRYAFVATPEAVYYTQGTDLYRVPRAGR